MTKALPPLSKDWLAHRFDPGQDAVHLIDVPRATRRAVPFLTDENLPSAVAPVIVRRDQALSLVPSPSPIHFIFHSAYCCSTLLANAFDEPGISASLKEPVILNDLVGWRHRGGMPGQVATVLESALTLLARPVAGPEPVVIKPSNVVNGLAQAMLAMRADARAILLYAPLPVYLGSIASKGLWGRRWVRDLLAKLRRDELVEFGIDGDEWMMLTDLQVAALGWLAQHRLFAHLANRWPDRVRTLDSEVLLERPDEAMAAISALMGLGYDRSQIAVIVVREFSRNAKFGGDFGKKDRVAGQQAANEIHADELEKVTAWAEAVADGAGISFTLPNPLLS